MERDGERWREGRQERERQRDRERETKIHSLGPSVLFDIRWLIQQYSARCSLSRQRCKYQSIIFSLNSVDSLHLGYTLVSKSLLFIVLRPFPPFRVRRFRLPRDLEDEQQRLLQSFQKSCGDAWNGNPGRPQCIYWPILLSQSSRKHSPHLTSFLCLKGCTRSWRSQQSPSPPVQQSVPPGWGCHGVAIIYHRSIRFHAAFYLLLNAVGLRSVPILACQHHPKISSNITP